MSKSQQPISKKKKVRVLILTIMSVLAILLIALAQLYRSFDKAMDKIIIDDQDDAEIILNEEVEAEGYRNIVIFGLDTRDNSLKRGNSDTILVASIENKTKDVKLVSIYRDTYVNIPKQGYDKINAAYANGGYALAINTINHNLDLDITEYVTVSFKAVVNTIDLVGGITLDITEEERPLINGYTKELNRINGTNVSGLSSAGTQSVNGTQATAYARIRYTEGGDFKRTERQRIVLSKTLEKVKSSKLTTLIDLIDEIFPQTATNLSRGEIMGLAKDILSYDIVDQSGFPFDNDIKTYQRVSYVFPVDLATNVTSLHEFLFNEAAYEPSSRVREYSDYIEDIRSR